MSRLTEGPTASYSCHGCAHYRQSRYSCQGDSGYDKSCAFTYPPRDMAEFGGTPAWCPILMRTKQADLTDEDRETLKYLRGCAMAETRRTRIPDRDRAFKLIDKLLAREVGR